jgi:elongation factor P--(R)-beta-lysine ligase
MVPVARPHALGERGALVAGVRAFFGSRGFLEVETPIVVPSPGLDVHLDAFTLVTRASEPARFLSTSPEYRMKRLLAAGHARIFQLTKAFRRGELGARHNPEFTMLEWYRAPAGVEDVMRDTEQLVARLTSGHVTLAGADGAEARTVDTLPPFRRMTVAEAFKAFAGVSPDDTFEMAARDEDRFFRVLVDVVEPAIAALGHALFLTEYPASQASLARTKPGDPRVAERFELYVAGVELCNGFGELTDAAEQRARLVCDQATRRERGLAVYPIDERFLAALESGLPACAGNALGLDRLVALACGTTEIADVMAFPADAL